MRAPSTPNLPVRNAKESNAMYYAQMFDYGTDQNHVGVTGIVGCLGAVFAAPAHLYAIHIPDMVNSNLIGANAFVAMVQGGEGALHPAGTLHVFVNGMQRPTADAEARSMLDGLGAPDTKVYRLMTGLDPAIAGAARLSAAIKVQLVAGAVQLAYKHVPDNQWVAGGNARTGRYLGAMADAPTCPSPGELAAAWNQVTNATCHIRGIH